MTEVCLRLCPTYLDFEYIKSPVRKFFDVYVLTIQGSVLESFPDTFTPQDFEYGILEVPLRWGRKGRTEDK